MTIKKETVQAICNTMAEAISDIEKAFQDDLKNTDSYWDILAYTSTALLTTITSFSQITEKAHAGSSVAVLSFVYRAIKKMLSECDEKMAETEIPSEFNVDPEDAGTVMVYFYERLSASFDKHLKELPQNMQTVDMALHGVESLLIPLLSSNFEKPEIGLIQFTDHVRLILNKLRNKKERYCIESVCPKFALFSGIPAVLKTIGNKGFLNLNENEEIFLLRISCFYAFFEQVCAKIVQEIMGALCYLTRDALYRLGVQNLILERELLHYFQKKYLMEFTSRYGNGGQ